MNYSDLSSKLTQVIEQIPKDALYDFCCSYAQEHEELAMALVNEFWRPEKDDYRSMVQQCLMHPTPAGIKNGDYEADHPYGETYGEVWWLRRKPLKEVLEHARVMLTELLITGDGIDDDSQRSMTTW